MFGKQIYCNLVNKLMTYLKTSKIKLGVLNMTIILDQPKSRRNFERSMKYSSQKIEEFASLTPNYHNALQQSFFTTHKGLTPYLRNKIESFRYAKNQPDLQRSALQQTARLPSRSNKLILQIKEDRPQRQDQLRKQNNLQLDSSFNLRQTKKQLKHTINVKHQYVQSDERVIILDLKPNPQQNFNSIFTVHPAKTSQRMKFKMPSQRTKIQKDSPRNPSISRREYRIKSNTQLQQRQLKRIRPWSTTKKHESRFNNYELDPFQRYDPELTRTN